MMIQLEDTLEQTGMFTSFIYLPGKRSYPFLDHNDNSDGT